MPTDSDSSKPPRCVADALGLGSLADADQGLDQKLLRELYRHARNEDGKRVLFENDPTFAKCWVNLDSARAQELLATLIDFDDTDDLKVARRITRANLEAAPWNDVLGIEEPPIRCRIKIHGSKWGLRFQAATPSMRGQEMLNEALPSIPDERKAAPSTETTTTPELATPSAEQQPHHPQPTPQTGSDAVSDALARGGLL